MNRPLLTAGSLLWLLLAAITLVRLAHDGDPVSIVVAWAGGVLSALLVVGWWLVWRRR